MEVSNYKGRTSHKAVYLLALLDMKATNQVLECAELTLLGWCHRGKVRQAGRQVGITRQAAAGGGVLVR